MTAPTIPVAAVPPLRHEEAAALAATENERFVALVRSLDAEDWDKPTDCPAWDVRAMASHVLAMMEAGAFLPLFVRQHLAGKRAAGDRPAVDGMTEVQVRERMHLSPAELTDQLSRTWQKAARRRTGLPGVLRRLPLKVEGADGERERWTLGFVFECILTRDTWMHRVDIARATGRPLELTPDHDGRLVADVVAEWARRHGRPFTLHLGGPAGGTFVAGEGGEQITLDAVEFCRTLSGRAPGTGLLTEAVPF